MRTQFVVVSASHERFAGYRRRWWILGALCLSLLVVGLDVTVLNVALTRIATTLGASTTQLQWIVNSYVLTYAMLMVPAGVLGDRIGRSKVLGAGLSVFIVASAVGAWVQSPGALIAVRTALGMAAAAVFPVAVSILPTVFPPEQRRTAIAVVAATMGIGLPLGPLVGGWLLDHFWWGSTLVFNIPIMLAALVAGVLLIPDSRDPAPRPLDLPGLVLSGSGLAALVYGIIQAPVSGWSDPPVVATIALGLVLLAAFAVAERRSAAPLAEPTLLRAPLFLWPTVAMALAAFVALGLIFMVPIYLQAVRGADALGTGIRLMPLMAGLLVGSAFGSAGQHRLGLRATVATGFVVLAAGFVLMLQVSPTTGYDALWPALVVIGLGFGTVMPPAGDAMLGSLAAGRESTGTALSFAVRQVGGAFGVAVLGSLVTAGYRGGITASSETLPAPLAAAVRDSVAAAAAIAERLGPAGQAIHRAAAEAYVAGMHHASVAGALTAIGAAVLMVKTLPGPNQQARREVATRSSRRKAAVPVTRA
jgi:EmrB/QacA subfamily drug resistance transporter